ncbi:MAG: hypothetical protein KGI35_02900 [Burkholderiales bacterium]|nr:hypothetical protein [Burkholderiales bacterium]MDE2395463.1 hypothetical protein [Burkholderiales bacterium]
MLDSLFGREAAPELPCTAPPRRHFLVGDPREAQLPDWARLAPEEAARRLGISLKAARRQIKRERFAAGLDLEAPDDVEPQAMSPAESPGGAGIAKQSMQPAPAPQSHLKGNP